MRTFSAISILFRSVLLITLIIPTVHVAEAKSSKTFCQTQWVASNADLKGIKCTKARSAAQARRNFQRGRGSNLSSAVVAIYHPDYETRAALAESRFGSQKVSKHRRQGNKKGPQRMAREPQEVGSFFGRVVSEILPHPAGCPRTRFCGCAVAKEVFGKPVARGGLALAANWRKFPPAAPAPGRVAWRYGHVFLIERVVRPGWVIAYDPNSGQHLTRRHLRSLAGYRVVAPNG